jgi:CheY-like chemotaxis protein
MPNHLKQIRVLHVEDDTMDSELTKLFLKKKGYDNLEISAVLSAEEALRRMNEEDFDVIVSDYNMPGMNGVEFLDVLRRKGNSIPFIIFTGKGEESVAMEALNKGANRYIKKDEKPCILFDMLGRYIQEVVEEKEREREREEERERVIKQLEGMNRRMQSASKTLTLERRGRKTYIDAYAFLNEYLDLIILGLFMDKNAPMSADDIKKELQRKFGATMINQESLNDSLNALEEERIIEQEFSKQRKSFVFKLEEGMDGLLTGSTFSSEMLTRFLRLTEGFKRNEQ